MGDAASTLTYSGVVSHALPKKRTGNRSLSPDAELLLTWMKLPHNFSELDLAQRFSISQSTVSWIFSTWVLRLNHILRESTSGYLKHSSTMTNPRSSLKSLSSTRVIIDATELPLEKQSNPDVQAATWLNYKNWNTLTP